MSSDAESLVANIQQNNYVTLIIFTAIGYDYCLTFSKEIEYIWNKPWTHVSTVFLLVRCFGLCAFVTLALVGTSFLPGPAETLTTKQLFRNTQGIAMGILGTWAVLIFILATDFMMILRLWAMYNRSRLILGVLLTSYVGEIIPSAIACIIYSNPSNVPMSVAHIQNFSFCALGFIPLGWNKASSITQLIHATVMCTLVIVRFIRQSFRMYKATKQWRINEFINLFVMEGVLYFLSMLGWNIVNTLYAWGNFSPAGWQIIFIGFVETVPFATMAPRFVLSVRELYARNVRGGRGNGIDSGFGLSTLSGLGMSRSTMVFADSVENDEGECGEGISMR